MSLRDLAKNPAPVKGERGAAVGAGVLGHEPEKADSGGAEPSAEKTAKSPAPTGVFPTGSPFSGGKSLKARHPGQDTLDAGLL